VGDSDLFIAVGCNIGKHEDGVHLRLRFMEDSGQTRDIVINRRDIPPLLASLQQEIVAGSVVPIDRGSLRIGADFQAEGYQCKRKSDGSATLTVAISLPEQSRTVTLPIDLPPQDAKSLAEHLLGMTS